jgi:Na+/H+-dicarboxylate symporter
MKSTTKQLWEAYRFPIILILAIITGSIIGLVMGEDAMALKPLGDIFLNLMFTIVVPLVFVTISSAVAGMGNMKRLGSILRSLFLVFIVTGLIAAVIMITTVTIFPPAEGANLAVEATESLEKLNTADQVVKAITVTDFPNLISRKNMLPLIIFSVFFGVCVGLIGDEGHIIVKGLDAASKVFMKMVNIIMYYAPIGLGAYFASLIGEFGPQLLGSYAHAMMIYYPVCILYFIIAFTLYSNYAAGPVGVKSFFKNIVSPAVTSIATQSSIATLPVNLEAAKRIGVPKDIREIVLPIGATMHMDGTCLSSILKISFLFGIYGIPFDGLGTWGSAILMSVMGGVVMSGVPGGGLIGEMLIVNLYGFPPEAFPIIATIGFLVDPPATMINACGDTVASMMVTRLVEGKDKMINRVKSASEIFDTKKNKKVA